MTYKRLCCVVFLGGLKEKIEWDDDDDDGG